MRHGRGGWVAPGCMTSMTTDPAGAPPRPVGHAFRAASAPVPPTQEIEILDPNVDPTGKPTAVGAGLVVPVTPGHHGVLGHCAPGTPGAPVQQIEVPPAVLVHKFYYTGNRSFQGPMLPGGPTIVSVSHPQTLERVYVPVTMPPGAPRVIYTADSIRYDYGPQSVTLIFGPCGNPRVRYSQASEGHEAARKKIEEHRTETRSWVQRTGVPQGLQRFKSEAKEACGAVADRLHDAGKIVVDMSTTVIQMIPGAQLLKSSPEDAAAREQERAQRAAEMRPDADPFVNRAP